MSDHHEIRSRAWNNIRSLGFSGTRYGDDGFTEVGRQLSKVVGVLNYHVLIDKQATDEDLNHRLRMLSGENWYFYYQVLLARSGL